MIERSSGHEPSLQTEKEPRFNIVDRLLAIQKIWEKRPARQVASFMGALSLVASIGYLKRQDILDFISNAQLNPQVVDFREKDWQSDHILHDHQVEASEIGVKQAEHEIGAIEIEDQEIRLVDEFKDSDRGPRIENSNVLINNMTNPVFRWVKPAEEPNKFHQFIVDNAKSTVSAWREYSIGKERVEGLAEGQIEPFIRLCQRVVNKNLHYEESTASWLTVKNGQIALKFGKDPIGALRSADDMPVDKLLMERKMGVCRHYAEAFAMVAEELKKLFGDRYQNIHVAPFFNASKVHVYDIIYRVKSAHQVEVLTYDPSGSERGPNPYISLLRTLYGREVIDKSDYCHLLEKSFTAIDSENYFDVLKWAIENDLPEARNLAAKMLDHYCSLLEPGLKDEKITKGQNNDIEAIAPYLKDYEYKTGPVISSKYPRIARYLLVS